MRVHSDGNLDRDAVRAGSLLLPFREVVLKRKARLFVFIFFWLIALLISEKRANGIDYIALARIITSAERRVVKVSVSRRPS